MRRSAAACRRAPSARGRSPRLLEDILRVANRAPSGTNTRPWRVYVLQGAVRDDLVAKACRAHDAATAEQQRDDRFLDAPVGLVFTVDDVLGRGALLDYGMFLQCIMVAARARGLHARPQASWIRHAGLVLPHVGAGSAERLVCGMALGYADESAPVNRLRTPHDELTALVRWTDG